ncbi:hypothetical protein Egran_04119 [Elaphomyces granulatus]|uniref:RNA polymerase II Elongator complex associated protein Kti12 n=1 Tax=Elaphomyces granulatus TaxID=519963 RepID=A0A232LVC0_9EURO|nr:hypothetical protein Egran_04119 [Elaphomyces granulatus]
MPLIILSGYPCSGLSYRARQLSTLLESEQQECLLSAETGSEPSLVKKKPRYTISIVPSHDSSHPRSVYDHARTEKEARGVVFSRVKRALGRDAIVIVDGMNYIKGWRYQLWCESKAVGTTCCVVHVGTPIDQCVANNEARWRRQELRKREDSNNNEPLQPQTGTQEILDTEGSITSRTEEDSEDPYPPELLNNLIFRYEEPSTHSRWDKPLFTVPWSDASPQVDEIWTAITGLPASKSLSAVSAVSSPPLLALSPSVSVPHSGFPLSDVATTLTTSVSSTLSRPKIKPHQVTVQPAVTDPTALSIFEKKTSAVVSAIRSFTLTHSSAESALAQSNDPRAITITVPDTSTPVFIPAHIATSGTTDELAGAGGILALPRLQRLRRQWIGLNRAYVGQNQGQGKTRLTVDQAGDAFVRFLNAEFADEAHQGQQ